MSKHTPGEWQKGEAGGCNIVSFDGFDIIGIAKVPNPFNMNLIAAAPDLLEALKGAVLEEEHNKYCYSIKGPETETWLVEEDCNCWVKDAKAAVAKAEGKEGA